MTIAFSSLFRKHRLVAVTNVTVFGMISLIMVGCATPVGINPVDIQTGYRLNTESALSSGQPSEASKMVLRRNGLMDRFEREPASVLAELHAGLAPTHDIDKLFALAELSMLYAQKSEERPYFLASAIYAWSILFPNDVLGEMLEVSDPRLRLTYDLYNQGLAEGLADAEEGENGEINVQLKAGEYKLPFGTLHLTMDESGLSWGGYRLNQFVSTTSLGIRGLRNRYRTPGLGASLAASIVKGEGSKKVAGSERLGPRTKVPVTAIVRFNNAQGSLTGGQIGGQIEVYATDQVTTVNVDGQAQTIESDPTAALAYQLNDSPIYAMEIAAFLRGGLFRGAVPKDRAQDGLFTLHPYRPGKIPVVLVHGTGSSPARWAELINELEGDPRIREKFQIWVFLYDSGNLIGYSAGLLRSALINALKEFDSDGKDPALQRMVVIGHSQGGLLTKLTAIDSGTRFWDRFSNKPFDQIKVSPEIRTLLQRSVFFTPLPFVKRVVFISTPQHGAMLAAYRWVTGLAARLVTLPATVVNGIAQAAKATGDERLAALLRRPPTAIDNMNPDNPGLKILASIPVPSHIRAHSIIAVEGDGPKEDGDDGVVTYKSAHIDEVVSEKVVRWGHSCQDQPETIEEVRRILMEHLVTPDLPNTTSASSAF